MHEFVSLDGKKVLKVDDGVCPCVTANETFADRDKRLVSFALTRVRLQCGRMSSHRMPGQQFPSSSRDMAPVVECYNSKIGTTPSMPSNFQFYPIQLGAQVAFSYFATFRPCHRLG